MSGEQKKTIGRGRLTDADRDRIDELAAQGLKAYRIAREINRHQATVHWYMYTQGLAVPKPNPRRPTVYFRNGRAIHLFTAEEDALITALRLQNFPLSTIAEQCSKRFGTGRTSHTVQVRLVMLAGREDPS